MKVLLIGSGDCFMSLLVDRLAKEGATVSIIAPTDFDNSCKPSLQYNLYHNSYTDEGMDRLVRSIAPDTVFFAGDIYMPKLNANNHARGKYIASLLNMLDYSKNSHVSKFIYMSSDEVYSREAPHPATEQTSLGPENAIGILCEQGEHICTKYTEVYKMRTVAMRFAPLFGFVSTDNLLKTLPVYSAYLSDQEEKRSYVYIKDAAEASVRVILNGEEPIYNVGGSESVSGFELARRMNKDTVLSGVNELDLSVDCSLIKKELEWYVRYDMDASLKEMQKKLLSRDQRSQKERDILRIRKKRKGGSGFKGSMDI